jgi:two-component system LytT family response regulator
VEIAGASSDPAEALRLVRSSKPDVLFLDVQMPGMSGFEFLEKLEAPQPLVVFTTAYDQYALEAFRVNSIDYLLKPIDPELDRALTKLERISAGAAAGGDLDAVLAQMRAMLMRREPEHITRIASRTGGRVDFINVADVSYFYSKDKLTFAVSASKHHPLELTIAELEQRLPVHGWVRIHRSTLVNIEAIKELHPWFGGKVLVKLKDGKTELQVSRERVPDVKTKLGL